MDALSDRTRDELLAGLKERHGDYLRAGEKFDLASKAGSRDLRLVVALFGGADGLRTEMDVKVDFQHTGVRGDDALGLAVDAIDLSLGEYLEAGRSERLPAAYEVRELDGKEVGFRGRVRRPSLEAEADRLLGEADPDEWL